MWWIYFNIGAETGEPHHLGLRRSRAAGASRLYLLCTFRSSPESSSRLSPTNSFLPIPTGHIDLKTDVRRARRSGALSPWQYSFQARHLGPTSALASGRPGVARGANSCRDCRLSARLGRGGDPHFGDRRRVGDALAAIALAGVPHRYNRRRRHAAVNLRARPGDRWAQRRTGHTGSRPVQALLSAGLHRGGAPRRRLPCRRVFPCGLQVWHSPIPFFAPPAFYSPPRSYSPQPPHCYRSARHSHKTRSSRAKAT